MIIALNVAFFSTLVFVMAYGCHWDDRRTNYFEWLRPEGPAVTPWRVAYTLVGSLSFAVGVVSAVACLSLAVLGL